MTPQEDLPREISEEMGLAVIKVADNPSYFITDQTQNHRTWFVNVVYETELENLDFTPSNECLSIKFVDKEDIRDMNVFPSVSKLAEMFDLRKHS